MNQKKSLLLSLPIALLLLGGSSMHRTCSASGLGSAFSTQQNATSLKHTYKLTAIQKAQIYRSYLTKYIKSDGAGDLFVNASDRATNRYTVSEGQGYGMLIVAASKASSQAVFDKMNRYYLKNRIPNSQLMSWKQDVDAGVQYPNNATDGDLYIAQALYKAYNRWGTETYRKQADAITNDILRQNYNPNEGILTVGSWVYPGTDMYHVIRPSDIIPTFFENFYQHNHDERWRTVKENGLDLLQQASAKSKHGMIPDFMTSINHQVGFPTNQEIPFVGLNNYGYESCRVPLNMSMSNDIRANKINRKFLNFLNSQSKIYAGYTLKGDVVGYYQDASFLAPIYSANRKYSTYRQVTKQVDEYGSISLKGNRYYPEHQIVLAQLVDDINEGVKNGNV